MDEQKIIGYVTADDIRRVIVETIEGLAKERGISIKEASAILAEEQKEYHKASVARYMAAHGVSEEVAENALYGDDALHGTPAGE